MIALCWKLIVLLAAFGGLAPPACAVESPALSAVLRRDVDTVGDTIDSSPGPVDPVIEEPLRPLLPEGQMLSPEPTRCGSMTPWILSAGLLLLRATRCQFLSRND